MVFLIGVGYFGRFVYLLTLTNSNTVFWDNLVKNTRLQLSLLTACLPDGSRGSKSNRAYCLFLLSLLNLLAYVDRLLLCFLDKRHMKATDLQAKNCASHLADVTPSVSTVDRSRTMYVANGHSRYLLAY